VDGFGSFGNVTVRDFVERRTAPMLVYLRSLPPVVLFVGVAGLAIAGMFTAGVVAGVLLGILAVLVTGLAYLTWPTLDASTKGLRALIVVIVYAVLVWRVLS
jgi:hypothetical protein